MPLDSQAIDLEDDEDLEEVQQIEDKLGFLQRVGVSERSLRRCSCRCRSGSRARRISRCIRRGTHKAQFDPKGT
jgi:hypothetical protein